MNHNPVSLAGTPVGKGYPCFIIAEAGVNHNGQVELAQQLVTVAAQSGANAVKFQTFTAENLVTPDAPQADYQVQNTGKKESQFDMLKRLELSAPMHQVLIQASIQQNVLFLSSPFDEMSADLLMELGTPAFKLGSGELTNLPLLVHIARFGKPMIISTGMANLGEVETALNTIYQAGNDQVILLHCVSNYPADPAEVNLRAMQTMQTAFGVPVGYSDHTLGNEIALAAVALGACMIEKHLTISRQLEGPEHLASSEPDELKALITGIRQIEAALGDGYKRPSPSEMNTAAVARKSVVANQDIQAGTVLTETMLAIKRPGTGLAPALRPHLIGRTARVTIPSGTVLSWEMLV